jgi:hypothetical protein
MEFNPMYGGVHINFFLGDFEFHFDHGFWIELDQAYFLIIFVTFNLHVEKYVSIVESILLIKQNFTRELFN